jgi:hypothetical protein
VGAAHSKILRGTGHLGAKVQHLEKWGFSIYPHPTTMVSLSEILMANWVEIALEGDNIYVTGCTKTEALQHTICANLKWTDDNDLVRGGFFSWPDSVPGQEWSATTVELSSIAKQVTQHRRLVKTSTAYLGIASHDTLPGDIVCILFGGSTLMILRPVNDHFLLVGECYVHGIMDGEALEGFNLERVSRAFEIW